MASNQLSDQDRKAIRDGVNHLFGRAVGALPCPLVTMDERRDLAWCMLDDEGLHALKTLTASFSSPLDIFQARAGIKMTVVDFDLHMTRKDADDGAGGGYFWGTEYTSEGPHVKMDVLARRVPKHKALLHWLDTTWILSKDIVLAHACFHELMGFCKTAGQIRRVLPELVDFAPQKVKIILSKQQRASSTPFEWSAFDRTRVEQLTDTMAKCMLLTTSETIKWSNRSDHTWPVVDALHREESSD